MILSDDVLFDLSQQDLIDSYLRGKTIEVPPLSESEKAFWREGTSIAIDLVDDEIATGASYAIQAMRAECPKVLGEPDRDETVPGFICHLVMFDFDSFSFFPRPVVAFAVLEKDVEKACGADEDDVYDALSDTLADKVAKAAV